MSTIQQQLNLRNNRDKCKSSFIHFVNHFWEQVPGAGKLVWNWHLDVLCNELQEVAERVFQNLPKDHDTIFNVSPGTSKSTICSILFPAWVWTRMPQARIMTASHTADLVLDLANKSRYVIRGELYRELFPNIVINPDQDTKGYFSNTLGGDRYTCTVAGKSPMGFHAHFQIVDDALDPKKAASEAEIKNAHEFFDAVLPGRMVDKTITVLFLVMQRLHEEDPTGHLLEKSRREGAGKIRHFCLPAEIPDDKTKASVSPPELITRYSEDGLMDRVRLPRLVLNERKADGLYAYAGQYLQNPVPPGGGLFKEMWFTKRVRASPYHSKRVLYVDKAFTVGDQSCNTAVTLLSENEGNFYVGPVWVGKWEPDERDLVILCAAQQCRDRFGSRYEPTVVIEQEPAAGIDSYRQLAKKLRGFKVQADPARANKVQRADPWACLVAGTLIQTESGLCRIENVRTGDRVLTRRGLRQVLWSGKTKDTTCITELCFNNGVRIRGTGDHRVFVVGKGWICFDQVCPDDEVINSCTKKRGDSPWESSYRKWPVAIPTFGNVKVKSIAHVDVSLAVPVYDLIVDDVHEFFANDVLVHNSQCAAGNVYLVDDGSWNIPEWIREHCLFPLAKLKDRVDSAAGGFNWLTKNTRQHIAEQFHILRSHTKKDKLRVISCAANQLTTIVLEEPALVIMVQNPADLVIEATPDLVPIKQPDLPYKDSSWLIDHTLVTFADLDPADLQQIWDQPLAPYNRLPADLLMTKTHSKQIWAMIRRQRTRQPDTILICGPGNIPQSLALAICDGLQLRRSESIELLGSDLVLDKDTKPLNEYIYNQCRDGRYLVM